MSTQPSHYGQYELQQCIEREANHETWKAFHVQQRRYVTVSIVHINEQSATAERVQRFQQEAQKLLALQHPTIVQVLDYQVLHNPDSATTDFWIVTEYVEGISLAAYLLMVTQHGSVPPPSEVVRLLATVGAALDYAHQHGVVHGNLNPAHILLDKVGTTADMPGRPTLIGFGTYSLQPPTTLPLADAAYISPEVANEQAVRPQSDIYSLGVILYQVCTGFLPFQGETATAIVQQHLQAMPLAPAVLNQYIPAALTTVILRSLAKDPALRFPTAMALVTAVAQALNMAIPEDDYQTRSQSELTNSPTYRTPMPPGAMPTQLAYNRNTGAMPRAASSPALTPLNPPSGAGIPAVNAYQQASHPGQPYPGQDARSGPVTPPPTAISSAWSTPNRNPVQADLATIAPPVMPPSAPPARKRSRKWLLIGSIVALLVVLGGLLATFILFNRTPQTNGTQNSIVGHAFFVSSGQVSLASNVGIADQLEVSLQNLPPPQAGKTYWVWLLSDSKTQALPLSLGQLSVQNGKATMFYAGDSQHSDILASYNRFLITQEDAGAQPAYYTFNKSDWSFAAVLSETPSPADTTNHFSLLDHTRHLLAQDPKLKAAGLIGGLDIWLFRNTQKILEWSGSARDSTDPAFIQRQTVRILDYLDGSQFVGTEHLPAGMAPIQVDPVIARVALLEIDQSQNPPGYLKHIANHLHEITQSPGVSADQQAIATRIITAIDNVEVWLKAVHGDAEKILLMPPDQLRQPAGQALLDDMFTQANNAFIGQTDPNTLQVKEGVAQIHYNIQRLATFEVAPCTASNAACQ
jgi:serine/threonine protein kinase